MGMSIEVWKIATQRGSEWGLRADIRMGRIE
jgi:hypothetical protein